MKKNLIIAFFSVLAFGILIFAGINFVVDPFSFFTWSRGKNYENIGNGSLRVRHYFELRNAAPNTYQGIIVGGSKSAPLSPDLLKKYTGYNYLRCNVGYGDFDYYEKIINFAISKQDIKHCVLHISNSVDLNLQPPENDENSYMPNCLNNGSIFMDYLHFLTISPSFSWKRISSMSFSQFLKKRFGHFDSEKKYQGDFQKTKSYKTFLQKTDCYDENDQLKNFYFKSFCNYDQSALPKLYDYWMSDKEAYEKWIHQKVLNLFGDFNAITYDGFAKTNRTLKHYKKSLDCIKRIKKICTDNNIELTVIVGANFIGEAFILEGFQFWNWLKELATITPYYDFSYINDINMNPYNFWEMRHNVASISWVILNKIFGNDAYSYGHFVNEGNVNELLEERIKNFYELEQKFIKNDKKVELAKYSDDSNFFVVDDEFFSNFTDVMPELPLLNEGNCAIDICNSKPTFNNKHFTLQLGDNKKNLIYLSGWGIDDKGIALSSMYIKIGNYVKKVNYGFSRPDMLKYNNNDEIIFCGYTVSIPLNEIKDKAFNVSFYGVSSDKKYLCKLGEYTLHTSQELPDANHKLVRPDFYSGLALDGCGAAKIDNIGKKIELKIENGVYVLYGWAFDSEKFSELSSLYVVSGENVVQAEYGLPRNDIKEWTGIDSNNFGFKCFVPSSFLDQQISFVMVSKDQSYKFEPISYKIIDTSD